MAYESVGGTGHHFPKPYLSRSPWSGASHTSNDYQYASVASPYEQQKPPQNKSQPSSISEYQPYEQNTPYSSRAHIIDNSSGPAYQLHGPSQISLHSLTGEPWQPGFWAQFPTLGLSGLLITVLATFACVVVLVKSDGVPIETWLGSLQPTVYLSICTAIANITLTFALYEGVVITFWRQAGRGTTLQELHQYWHSGSSLFGAFMGIFQFRAKITALACILTVISIGRGPLMQRASSVTNTIFQDHGNLQIFSAQRVPEGYAGRTTGRTSSPSFMNPNFTDIVQAYTNKDDIVGVWSGCKSTCYTTIKGFGFGVSCNTTLIPTEVGPITLPNNTIRIRDPVQVFGADAWQIPLVIPSVDKSRQWALLLNTTFIATPAPGSSYNTTLTQNLCALRSGIVSYPIQISNGTVSLQSNSWHNDTFLEDVGMYYLPSNTVSNMAGYILAAKALYYGTANLEFGGGVGWILNFNGASANRYVQRTDPSQNSYYVGSNITWRNPMEDMINSMREIAFRTSIQIAKDNTSYPNASQTVAFVGGRPETIYVTNYRYMTGAVVVSLLGVIAVLPLYRGFWELGRRVTLSPLEIAKAFDAPLLNSVRGNRPADAMLVKLGQTKVRYGDSGVVIGEQIISPFGDAQLVKRIGMGPVTGVKPPEKGVMYA